MIIALVLVSAFLHAAWNALLRVEADKDRALVAAVGAATLLAAIIAGLRWARGDIPFASLQSLGWSAAAGVFEWLYFMSLARALDRGPLGPIYTISRGGAILLVWPISVAIYGEHVTLASVAGSAVVFAGLALASGGTGDARSTGRSALAWAIACATSIAGYHLFYKAALRTGGSPSAVFAAALILASAINIARLGASGRAAAATLIRTRLPRVILMGLVCGGSFLILMEALSGGGAGFVLTLRNTSVLFATMLAFVIGERPRHVQIAGSVLVAAGAVLMAWA
ncbi:MAG: Integral rane protein [Myxococcales bacterium]|nr:Integral rane protein [Myxococcales bacterium]